MSNRSIVMSPDGAESEAPPEPGATRAGAKVQEPIRKSADFVFKEPEPDTDRMLALRSFEAQALHNIHNPGEPVGYIIHIPLKMGKSAQSIVRDGQLPPEKREKYKEFYPDDAGVTATVTPTNSKAINLSEDEILDELPEKTASLTGVIDQLGSGDLAGNRRIQKRLNSPYTGHALTEVQSGKTRQYPNSNVMAAINKVNWDIRQDTKKPWENFEKTPANAEEKLAATILKLAAALNYNMHPYLSQNIWEVDTPATALDLTMLGSFGSEWISWEPETLWTMLARQGAVNISAENREKLMALQVLHGNNIFWEEEHCFEKICLALNGVNVDFQVRQHVSIAQMAKAITISKQIKQGTFANEIAIYVAVKAKEEGLPLLPGALSFAQAVLNTLSPETMPIAKQLQMAYTQGWQPVGTDVISVQLAKLYAIEEYVRS